MDELTVVMRSLNMSPTIAELRAYMKSKNGRMSFADFLDIMHQHSTKVGIRLIIVYRRPMGSSAVLIKLHIDFFI